MAGEFHERLRAARLRAKLTQIDVAGAAEVSLTTYKAWEAAVRQPELDRLPLLAAALGVDASSLAFGGEVARVSWLPALDGGPAVPVAEAYLPEDGSDRLRAVTARQRGGAGRALAIVSLADPQGVDDALTEGLVVVRDGDEWVLGSLSEGRRFLRRGGRMTSLLEDDCEVHPVVALLEWVR